MVTSNKFYSKQGLWTLFLICALPLHIWTLFLGFRDFDWVTARTNSWDAVGVISYGLLFTFFESLIIFATTALLGFLISRKWDEKKRVALLGTLILILSLWSIVNQTYFIRTMQFPEQLSGFYVNTGRPLVALYLTAFLIVSISVVIPAYAILVSQKVEKIVWEGFDRFSTLMILYLVFDVISLTIIFIRNL
ncbi:MAG: hypothetical protein U0V18_10945 [Anaerolineales bacterium]